MPKPKDLIRLKFVKFSGSVNVGGFVAMAWEDGYQGWTVSLRPDSGVLILEREGRTFAVSPHAWVSCEVLADLPAPAPNIVIKEIAEPIFNDAPTERITPEDVRSRQRKKQQDRNEQI